MKNFADEILLRAYHESAHAYAHFYHFKGLLKEVAITENGGYCEAATGRKVIVERSQIPRLVKREALFRLAIASCAGKAAMDHWYGYKAKKETNWGNSDDRRHALSECLKLADGDKVEAEAWLKVAECRAARLVEKNWSAIGKGAFALVEHEKQTGEQIEKIFAAA